MKNNTQIVDRIGSRRDNRTYLCLMLPSFAVLFILTVVPLFYTLYISFTNYKITSSNMRWIGLSNYAEAFGDSKLWHSILIMLIQTVAGVALQMLLGLLFALLLQKNFKGVKVCRALFILPWAVAPVVAGLMWRMLFNTDYGWINYYLDQAFGIHFNWLGDHIGANIAIILTNTWVTTPAVGIMILAALQAINQDYYDAAAIDGANKIQRLFHIILPMIRPTFLLAFLIRLMDSIRQFDISYAMTGGGPGNSTESLNLYAYYQTFKNWRIGYGSCLSVLMLVIIIVSILLLLKQINKDV